MISIIIVFYLKIYKCINKYVTKIINHHKLFRVIHSVTLSFPPLPTLILLHFHHLIYTLQLLLQPSLDLLHIEQLLFKHFILFFQLLYLIPSSRTLPQYIHLLSVILFYQLLALFILYLGCL